ncbi:MAG: DUF4390 domain-containing protein [Proteobacteria bacterium]|nr:DUF4390 domain-containing protein [Pseudomonadota bacterium]
MVRIGKYKIFHAAVALLLCIFLWAIAIPAADAADGTAISDIVVANSRAEILLYCKVVNAFTTEMEKGIRNGIPATFTFYVDVYSNKNGQAYKVMLSHTFDHTLTYDSLKDEYVVELAEKGGKRVVFEDISEAKKRMAELNGLATVQLDALSPGNSYTVRVKARLAKKTLPLNFHYLIPFWGLGDFETDYSSVVFQY